MTTPAHIQAVLECPLPGAEGVPDGSTVRDYLKALLTRLWIEAEGFGGKRPFGNSGWQFDVYVGLVKAGLLAGQIDDDGYLDTVDQAAGDNLILAAIDAL